MILLILIFGSSVLIAIFGTITNTMSLSYFISKIMTNRRTRNSDTPTIKIFAALNFCDLLISVMMAFLIFDSFFKELAVDYILYPSVLVTGYLTCLLTAVRAIHLIFPLHVINWTAVKSLSATYTAIIGLTIVIKFVDFEESKNTEEASVAVYIQFALLVSLFLTVVLLNVISFGKLYLCKPSRAETWRRTATVTVGIISLIYCVCNVGFVISFGWRTVSVLSFLRIPHDQLLMIITYYILLPLNSACSLSTQPATQWSILSGKRK